MEAQAQDAYEPQRRRMVEEIAALARETRAETGRATLSERVHGGDGESAAPRIRAGRAEARSPTPTGRCRSAWGRPSRSRSSSR